MIYLWFYNFIPYVNNNTDDKQNDLKSHLTNNDCRVIKTVKFRREIEERKQKRKEPNEDKELKRRQP